MATDIQAGDECVVATPAQDGEIEFGWFRFSHKQVMPDDTGKRLRVFFGQPIRSDRLSKTEAATGEPYSVFFNVLGHFKRPSALRSR